ncbi:MAG: alternate F1F0 ATPase, F1 subunit alpha, partial [Gammaproteobacteria bacterium]
QRVLEQPFVLRAVETGTITSVGESVAVAEGIPTVLAQELVRCADGTHAIAFNLDPDSVGLVLLDGRETLAVGMEVRRTGRVIDVPVGGGLLGRMINGLGIPLDDRGPLRYHARWPVEREAPGILDRAPIARPLATGVKSIDALIPIGRGQRELILGDRQSGKTAIAVSTLLHQRDKDVVCVYCAIGQRSSAVARVLETLRANNALDYTVVVAAGGEDPPGLQFITPYAATTIAEYFMEQGRDVLIIYDDLTRHADAYRQLSLLLRRPPGREAFPGDMFYVHARLLERAGQYHQRRGGGSLTALPIIETEAENISAYIPTNLVSITDGQVYLSPNLFRLGVLPAVDVGKSVSRVGGKAQLAAFRSVAGALRLSYSQFEELETFARFGTRLDEDTRRAIERGRRVREVLKQDETETLTPCEQLIALLSVTAGVFDDVPLDGIAQRERTIRLNVPARAGDICARIEAGEKLTEADGDRLLALARDALAAP